MLTVKGIYDGKQIRPLKKLSLKKKYKVVITFLEEIEDSSGIRAFTSQSEGFSFWEDEREDIYQDLLKRKS
ncbi:MAG: hypothetical protein HY708_03620 [Ignavibacteriae bacterium]|nr:hypothetical protein [Ignavibacteriota bacterium]